MNSSQGLLFEVPAEAPTKDSISSTFQDNMKLPVHRWLRYSAGFSGAWAKELIASRSSVAPVSVFDPFAGSGTTLIAAEDAGCNSIGVEAHPFVVRVARAKLHRRSNVDHFRSFAAEVVSNAAKTETDLAGYPDLIQRCYEDRKSVV